MAKDRNEALKQKAYDIWESEGRPEGMHDEHWARAERELGGETAEKPRVSRGRKTPTASEEAAAAVADMPVKKKSEPADPTMPAAQKPKRPARTSKS